MGTYRGITFTTLPNGSITWPFIVYLPNGRAILKIALGGKVGKRIAYLNALGANGSSIKRLNRYYLSMGSTRGLAILGRVRL